jgi:hypothetical protein
MRLVRSGKDSVGFANELRRVTDIFIQDGRSVNRSIAAHRNWQLEEARRNREDAALVTDYLAKGGKITRVPTPGWE